MPKDWNPASRSWLPAEMTRQPMVPERGVPPGPPALCVCSLELLQSLQRLHGHGTAVSRPAQTLPCCSHSKMTSRTPVMRHSHTGAPAGISALPLQLPALPHSQAAVGVQAWLSLPTPWSTLSRPLPTCLSSKCPFPGRLPSAPWPQGPPAWLLPGSPWATTWVIHPSRAPTQWRGTLQAASNARGPRIPSSQSPPPAPPG